MVLRQAFTKCFEVIENRRQIPNLSIKSPVLCFVILSYLHYSLTQMMDSDTFLILYMLTLWNRGLKY